MSYHVEVPPLIVGFDTETTGLDTNEDEIISYGFAVFRDGRYAPEESGQFFAYTDRPIHPRALEVHGLHLEDLRQRTSAWGGPYSPAEGVAKAIRLLHEFRDQGARTVGAFPKFDFDMLRSMAQRYGNLRFDWSSHIRADFKIPVSHRDEFADVSGSVETGEENSGNETRTYFQRSSSASKILAMMKPNLSQRDFFKPVIWPEIIDVCAFDRVHWPDITRRRGLTALCEHYGVQPGGHDSLGDARAAVEVWLQQIRKHQMENEPTFLSDDF